MQIPRRRREYFGQKECFKTPISCRLENHAKVALAHVGTSCDVGWFCMSPIPSSVHYLLGFFVQHRVQYAGIHCSIFIPYKLSSCQRC